MRNIFFALSAALWLAGSGTGNAQENAAAPPVLAAPPQTGPKTTAQLLLEIKESNAKTLESQTALLKRLEELKKQADQVRIFARRG